MQADWEVEIGSGAPLPFLIVKFTEGAFPAVPF